MALSLVTSGATALSTQINQIINWLNGSSGSHPMKLQTLNDPTEYGLLVQNQDGTNGRQIISKKADGTVCLQVDNNGVPVLRSPVVAGTLKTVQGANIASATSLTLGTDGNFFLITGTTTITGITATSAGHEVVLQFQSAGCTVVNGGNIRLAGSYYSLANSTLKLVCDGTNWNEVARAGDGPLLAVVQRTTDQANGGANVKTAVSWSSAVKNYGAVWSAGSPTRLTVPAGGAGLWLLQGALFISPTDSDKYSWFARKNGGGTDYILAPEINEDTTSLQVGAAFVRAFDLAAADYIEVIWRGDDANGPILGNANGDSHVSFRRIAA